MMWRHVDLLCAILSLVLIVAFWCGVDSQSDKNEPPSSSLVECFGRQCVRYRWTSMWGFIVTFIALTMDVWGASKGGHKKALLSLLLACVVATLYPSFILWIMLNNAVNGMAMLANLREALGDDVIAPLYPWRKSNMKIILGSKVIVNLSPDIYTSIDMLRAFKEVEVKDLSEALVIGPKVIDCEQFNVQLSLQGQLALLRSNVLPPYDELKFLRGHSSLGMAIASAQATGYIYGIIVRCVQGLRVSPIEAIATSLNIVIIMKGVLHNFASLGHRPLLLYLQPEEEAKFIEECKKVKDFEFTTKRRLYLGVSIACGILLAVGVYFIASFFKTLRKICVVPIVLFEVSLMVGGIHVSTLSSNDSGYSHNLEFCMLTPISWVSSVAYVWALVVTFAFWKKEEFYVQSSNSLSHVLPYIG